MNPKLNSRNTTMKAVSDKFIWFDLCVGEVFEATRQVASSEFNKYPFDVPSLLHLGGAIEDIVVHAEGTNFTSKFTYLVVLERRFTNVGWVENDGTLLSLVSATGYNIGSAFSTRSKFGRLIRPALYTQVGTSGSGTHYGELSLSLGVRLFR